MRKRGDGPVGGDVDAKPHEHPRLCSVEPKEAEPGRVRESQRKCACLRERNM